MAQGTGQRLGRTRLHGLERGHGIAVSPGDPPLEEEKHQRDGHDDDAQGGGEVAVVGNLAHKLIVENDWEGAISLANEHGCAEVGKHTHENQQRRGQYRGHDQRKNDAGHTLEVAGAQAFGRFIKRVVQVFQRAANIHIHKREGLKRKH